MDGTFYTDVILRETLLPYIKAAFPGGHKLIQDNDPKHRSKKAKEFMETNGINLLSTWPSGIFFCFIIIILYLTHISLMICLWEVGKQRRPRLDSTDHGI